MTKSKSDVELSQNKLLGTLPKKVRDRLAPLFEQVELSFDEILYEPEEPIRHIYFPTSGIVSLLVVLENGCVAEVGRTGSEGMVGLPVFFGVKTSYTRAFVQIPGEALRIKTAAFVADTTTGGSLFGAILRYSQALMWHSERLTACNTWHTIEQRLCRWLLVTRDRIQTDVVQVTQEFLSQMLGAHRQSVTLAASNLQRAGLIRYSRGKLTILNRSGLEKASCECYRAIQQQFDQLFAATGG